MLHYEQLCGENCFKTDIDFANIKRLVAHCISNVRKVRAT